MNVEQIIFATINHDEFSIGDRTFVGAIEAWDTNGTVWHFPRKRYVERAYAFHLVPPVIDTECFSVSHIKGEA